MSKCPAIRQGIPACQKSLFDKLPAFFKLLKSLKNGTIERERQP